MKRALYGFVSLGLGLLSQSCVEDTAAVYAAGLVAPDDECVLAEDADFLFFASYDPRTGLGYQAAIRVENQLLTRQTDIAADPMGVHITNADITLMGLDGGALGIGAPNPFRIPASGYIPSSEDGTPSVGVVAITAIPASVGSTLLTVPGAVVVVEVTLIGHTTGGLDIITEPFQFPVDIVSLCDPMATNGCRAGQDGVAWSPGVNVACP